MIIKFINSIRYNKGHNYAINMDNKFNCIFFIFKGSVYTLNKDGLSFTKTYNELFENVGISNEITIDTSIYEVMLNSNFH